MIVRRQIVQNSFKAPFSIPTVLSISFRRRGSMTFCEDSVQTSPAVQNQILTQVQKGKDQPG
jgi:hypothetical protein